MRSRASGVTRLAVAALVLLLAACASQPVQVTSGWSGPRHPPPASPERPVPDGAPKVGAPYQIAGRWYTPYDDPRYDTIGMASWYGPGFHGQYTANGEYYDQRFVTAAHKTLPLPCYVEVTALDTGRKITVRVNDRGPFVGDRVIDLSRGAAERLGIVRSGLTRVRVRRVYPDERVRLALRSGLAPDAILSDRAIQYARVQAPPPLPPKVTPAAAPPRALPALPPAAPMPVAVATAAVVPSQADLDRDGAPLAAAIPAPSAAAIAPAPAVETTQVFAGTAWIQVAALADQGRATSLANLLRPIGIATVELSGGLWRVRLGPYDSELSARTALAKVQAAGYQEAHLVRTAAAG
jgi:rare lipoprotein A